MTRDSKALPEFDEGPAIGSTVGGKYMIEALLGRGGMGAVYRARHLVTGRRVAIKWLIDTNASLKQRFLREARAMGFIEHPSVVSVLDVSDHEGAAFIVMELLRGQSLSDYLGGKPCPIQAAIEVLMPALEGLAAVHHAGIIHRDLKPDNIFVCKDAAGNVLTTKLLDLGVARLHNTAHDDLTVSGAIIGTPRYMSPEQLRGLRDVDARADIFALGLILYEMFTARLPYDASTYESLVIDIVTSDPPSPRVFRFDLPEPLAAVVLKALCRDRDRRYPDVASLAHALEPFAKGVRFTPPTDEHVRGSVVPDAQALGELAAATLEAPRKSHEPTLPQRHGPKLVQAHDDESAAGRGQLAKTTLPRGPRSDAPAAESVIALPVARSGRAIVLALLGVLVLSLAGWALSRRTSAPREVPVATRPAQQPIEPPAPTPTTPQPLVAAPVLTDAAPTDETPRPTTRRPTRSDVPTAMVDPAPTMVETQPATPPTPMRTDRPTLEVIDF